MVSAHQNAQLDWQRTKETTTAKPGVWHRTVPWRQPNTLPQSPPTLRMTYRRASGVSASRASSSMWSPPPEHRGPVPTAPPARDSLTSRQSANPSLPQIANPLRRSSAKPRASFLPPAKASSNVRNLWRPPARSPRGRSGSLHHLLMCPPLFFASHTSVITRDPRGLGGWKAGHAAECGDRNADCSV